MGDMRAAGFGPETPAAIKSLDWLSKRSDPKMFLLRKAEDGGGDALPHLPRGAKRRGQNGGCLRRAV
jgi:hypothetical protein